MTVPEPIAPIRDHFFEADGTRQEATGCLTVGAFFGSLREVRRERRRRRSRSASSNSEKYRGSG
jgi:hypothetical protein